MDGASAGAVASTPPSYPVTPNLSGSAGAPAAATTTTVTTLTTTTETRTALTTEMPSMETLIDSIDRSNNVLSMILRGLFAKVADQERALQAERTKRQELEEMIAQGGLGKGNVSWEDLDLHMSQATGNIL